MIPGLPQVGGMELVILLSIILLFFGANRIPDLARSLGKGMREFREGIRGATSDDKEVEDREKAGEKSSLERAGRGEKAGAIRPEQKS